MFPAENAEAWAVKVMVVVVGKARGVLAEAVREYEHRAGRYWKLEVVEVGQESARSLSGEQVKAAEARRILDRIPVASGGRRSDTGRERHAFAGSGALAGNPLGREPCPVLPS